MKSPIFIIGNPRSGTTLLRLMLTCHKHIVIPPECGFALWLRETYKNWKTSDDILLNRFIYDLMHCKKIETWQMNENTLHEFLKTKSPSSYTQAVSSVYEYYGISKGKHAKRWGDKNNYYLDHILTIKEMFPDACFVHIVRDGRDVACSYKELGKKKIGAIYAPRLPDQIEAIAREWKGNMDTINGSFESIGWDHVYEIRFEDILKTPSEHLKKLCEQIAEPYDPAMLEYHRMNRKHQLEPEGFMKWKEKTFEPPNIKAAEKYKTILTTEELRVFEKIAGKYLKHYGYK